jgi:hypothetical protein
MRLCRREKMLSEDWIRNYLATNENFLREKRLKELNPKKIRNDFQVLDGECRDLIVRSLFTGRNHALRKILELDNKVKGKGNDKASKAKHR